MQLTRFDIIYIAYLYLGRTENLQCQEFFFLKIVYVEIGKNLIHLSNFEKIFIIITLYYLINIAKLER